MGTTFYKYRSINDNTLNSLDNKYFYFSQPCELNDPFDGKVAIKLEATKFEINRWCDEHQIYGISRKKLIIDYNNGKLEENADGFAEKVSNKFFILCLSQVWNESLMWAHYADSFKGICIGYNAIYLKNTYFLQLELLNKNNNFYTRESDHYLCPLVEIKYDKFVAEPYNMFKKNYDAIKKCYLYKEKKWEKEKEYRAILFDENEGKFEKRIYYKSNILKEIIFGNNVKDDQIRDIRNIINRKYSRSIKYYKIKANKLSMELIKEEIAS